MNETHSDEKNSQKDTFVWDDVKCDCGYSGPSWARDVTGDGDKLTVRDYCPQCEGTVEKTKFENREGTWFK